MAKKQESSLQGVRNFLEECMEPRLRSWEAYLKYERELESTSDRMGSSGLDPIESIREIRQGESFLDASEIRAIQRGLRTGYDLFQGTFGKAMILTPFVYAAIC